MTREACLGLGVMVGTPCLEQTEDFLEPVPAPERELVPERGLGLELEHVLVPGRVREPAPGLEPVREHAVLERVPGLELGRVRGLRQRGCIQTWAFPSCQ